MPLRDLLGGMQARNTCPQIELAGGDRTTALVLRHLEPLSPSDLQALRDFAQKHGVEWWLQPKGPDTVHRLDNADSDLFYALPEFGIRLPFKPTDFTQVNPRINRVLVQQALQLLDVKTTERVIDWFCGLGNFTLPLATQAAGVLGVEGSEALVQRASQNLGLQHARLAPTRFVARNLFEMTAQTLVQDGVADKWLMDPPREGAFALTKALVDACQDLGAYPGWQPPQRIVYVSCNPATLARDAGLLVNVAGYRCTAAGVVNMFPHTAHVESMAVFDRIQPAP
jgi:23S rRNA (uracil1939-C5)-methyltransferase